MNNQKMPKTNPNNMAQVPSPRRTRSGMRLDNGEASDADQSVLIIESHLDNNSPAYAPSSQASSGANNISVIDLTDTDDDEADEMPPPSATASLLTTTVLPLLYRTRRLLTAAMISSTSVATPPRLHNITVDLTDSPEPSPNLAISPTSANAVSTPPSSSGEISCPVCLDPKSRVFETSRRMVSTLCGHIFCSRCLPTCIQNDGKCPTCRRPLKTNGYHYLFI